MKSNDEQLIMGEISRTKVPTPTNSKPLVLWAAAVSTLAVVLLILGFGNSQYQNRFQQSNHASALSEEVQVDKSVHDYTKWLLPKGAKNTTR